MPSQIQGLTTPFSSTLDSASATGSSKMGKNEFLKLLVAQLANQDPLAPTDNQQFIAQLAQFSAVEQAENTNQNLESLMVASLTANKTATSAFIGKDVLFESKSVTLGDGDPTLMADLAGSARKVKITVKDATGKLVRTIEREDVPAGQLSVPWDGKDEAGGRVARGTYTVEVEARDAKGNSVTVTQRARGRCTAVSFESGTSELIINGTRVPMPKVIQIIDPPSTATPAPSQSKS